MGIAQILILVIFTIRIVVAFAVHGKIDMCTRDWILGNLTDMGLFAILYVGFLV